MFLHYFFSRNINGSLNVMDDNMKLSSFSVENFKCIGREINIKIDNIIILIGQNNVGKSTILDAYEKFAILGKEKILDISYFHNEDISNKIIMTGVFVDITEDDR